MECPPPDPVRTWKVGRPRARSLTPRAGPVVRFVTVGAVVHSGLSAIEAMRLVTAGAVIPSGTHRAASLTAWI